VDREIDETKLFRFMFYHTLTGMQERISDWFADQPAPPGWRLGSARAAGAVG
jgi:hypothetical protein